MDVLEAQFIYCLTICCNLVGILRFVKAVSFLSREQGLRRGLEYNIDYGKGRGDVFGEVLS